MDPTQPPLDLARAPTSLEELVDEFETLSCGLVLLEPSPLAAVRSAAARLHQEVRAHTARIGPRLGTGGAASDPLVRHLAEVVRTDHRWFEISFEQLGWFQGIAEGNDHGGNRQALGQYGRLVAEALRRHLSDERRLAQMRAVPQKH